MPTGRPDWWKQQYSTVEKFPATYVDTGYVTQTTTIPPGQSEAIIVRANPGFVFTVVGLMLLVEPPPGATAGTHSFEVQGEGSGITLLKGVSTYAAGVKYAYGYWLEANSAQYPPSDAAQAVVVKGFKFDQDTGIIFIYKNNTDADQTNERIYALTAESLKRV